jgi:hypothetical protein
MICKPVICKHFRRIELQQNHLFFHLTALKADNQPGPAQL